MNENTFNPQADNPPSASYPIVESLAKQDLLTSSDTHSINAELQENLAIDSKDESPWFIQLFLSISGLLSGLSLIGFLALLFNGSLDSRSVIAIIGIVLLAISFGLYRYFHKNAHTFFSSLAFAISIAGQIFLTVAIFDYSFPSPSGFGLLMLIQVVLIILIPDFLHRLVSSLIALSCLVWLMSYYGLPEAVAALLALITAVFGLQRYKLLYATAPKIRTEVLQISRALAYASSIMLLIVSVYFITSEYSNLTITDATQVGNNDLFIYNYPLAQGLLILVAIYTAYVIMKRYGVSLLSNKDKTGMVVVASITLLGILSVYVSGLLAASIVCVIAIANRQRVLLSLAIIALVSYVFWYYYQLDTTLLVKSLSMLIVGIALLITRWVLVRRIFTPDIADAQNVISTDDSNQYMKPDDKESGE